MGYVAFLVQEEICLSLLIKTPYSRDTGESYLVNLIPLVKNSFLSQLVGPDLCPYERGNPIQFGI
jgi:hypothetical protein